MSSSTVSALQKHKDIARSKREEMPRVLAWLTNLQSNFEDAQVLWAIDGDRRYRTPVQGYAVSAVDLVLSPKVKA